MGNEGDVSKLLFSLPTLIFSSHGHTEHGPLEYDSETRPLQPHYRFRFPIDCGVMSHLIDENIFPESCLPMWCRACDLCLSTCSRYDGHLWCVQVVIKMTDIRSIEKVIASLEFVSFWSQVTVTKPICMKHFVRTNANLDFM